MKRLITRGNWPAWAMLLGFLMLLAVLNAGFYLPKNIFWIVEIPLIICVACFGGATIAVLVRIYRFWISAIRSEETKGKRIGGFVAMILASLAVLPFIGLYWFGTLVSGFIFITNGVIERMAQH